MASVPTPHTETIYVDIKNSEQCTEIESMCPRCEMNGMTRLLLTDIPFFREVIIMAFSCEHCGERNHTIQSSSVCPEGVHVSVEVTGKADLNREVVRSETAVISIPELEFVIPPLAKGLLTTIEGVLTTSLEDLQGFLAERMVQDPETTLKLLPFLEKLKDAIAGETPFTLVVDDPAGNSHVQPLTDGIHSDTKLKVKKYVRTAQQNFELGLGGETNFDGMEPERADHTHIASGKLSTGPTKFISKASQFHAITAGDWADEIPEEVMLFPDVCSACYEPGALKMMITNIPHFKEVVIMAFTCEYCNYRSTEVKTGGEVSPHGERITLRVNTVRDLTRDILKSDTACVHIPELELELEPGTLGGRFSTLEGLLTNIRDALAASGQFSFGDSATAADSSKWATFLRELESLREVSVPFTFVLDDALANSYIGALCDDDPQLTLERYTRTKEQDDELGLSDMNVDHYLADPVLQAKANGSIKKSDFK